MSILDIATEIDRLRVAGKAGLLKTEDLSGGTFTFSNIGNLGGTSLHPVLPPSQVCIAAMGKSQRLPRFVTTDGVERVVAAEIATVSFCADHRVVDGATVARFFAAWKAFVEQPGLALVSAK